MATLAETSLLEVEKDAVTINHKHHGLRKHKHNHKHKRHGTPKPFTTTDVRKATIQCEHLTLVFAKSLLEAETFNAKLKTQKTKAPQSQIPKSLITALSAATVGTSNCASSCYRSAFDKHSTVKFNECSQDVRNAKRSTIGFFYVAKRWAKHLGHNSTGTKHTGHKHHHHSSYFHHKKPVTNGTTVNRTTVVAKTPSHK